MTERVQNGSGTGAQLASSHSHEEFIQLCALSTSGELTAEEWTRLGEHLLQCPSCREIKRQYESVVRHALPVLAEASAGKQEVREDSYPWSVERAEASLMEALDAEHPPPVNVPVASPKRSEGKHLWVYMLAALFLLCCGAVLYKAQSRWRQTPALQVTARATAALPANRNPVATAAIPTSEDIQKDQKEIVRLREKVRLNSREVDRLTTQRVQLQHDLTTRADDLNASAQQNAALEQQLASERSSLSALQGKLNLAQERESQAVANMASLQNEVATLNVALQEGNREAAQDEQLLAHDRDIRDLMGARNLYIAEIYDVSKTGATKKPFGRVFYTKNKSLIFYGYDLDQQPGLKDASTFQAWGRVGSSAHDVSLGLFYQDDANKKRWILKCDDPRTLARLDAVFVTVEPKGGSAKPTSKPLLFTYLRLEPNHP